MSCFIARTPERIDITIDITGVASHSAYSRRGPPVCDYQAPAIRSKSRSQSPLEGIPGVGPKRRQALLRHFGGIRELARASVSDIARVAGMSHQTAELVYSALHTD